MWRVIRVIYDKEEKIVTSYTSTGDRVPKGIELSKALAYINVTTMLLIKANLLDRIMSIEGFWIDTDGTTHLN